MLPYQVMDNENIREALIEAINELKSKIESVDPKETIKLANVKRYQINPTNQMNEDKIQRLVNRIVKEVRE